MNGILRQLLVTWAVGILTKAHHAHFNLLIDYKTICRRVKLTPANNMRVQAVKGANLFQANSGHKVAVYR